MVDNGGIWASVCFLNSPAGLQTFCVKGVSVASVAAEQLLWWLLVPVEHESHADRREQGRVAEP